MTRHRRSADSPSLYARDGGRKYLNHAERQRALAAMAALERNQALFALTLAWTGARVSEVLALFPQSFQIEACMVSIITLKRRRFHVREVPIPPGLMVDLVSHFALCEAQRDPLRATRRLWPRHRVTGWRVIKNAMMLAQIVGRAACPRGLRHAFGVGTLQAGVPLHLTQRWMGHARPSTTAVYADVSGPEEIAFAALFWRANEGCAVSTSHAAYAPQEM
jgi:site-specific recombinase XerD